MHTVELLEHALALAKSQGIQIRQDWFGGNAGGACELKGRPWIFVDLALSPREQLDQVVDALRILPGLAEAAMSPTMRKLLELPKAA